MGNPSLIWQRCNMFKKFLSRFGKNKMYFYGQGFYHCSGWYYTLYYLGGIAIYKDKFAYPSDFMAIYPKSLFSKDYNLDF